MEALNARASKSDWKAARSIITPNRLRWTIKTFQPYKSPGLDGIHPIQLQKSVEMLMPHMVKITRASLAFVYIPEAWRVAKVVFIRKIVKKEMDLPKSYRPISLTSFLLKSMEKVVNYCIMHTVLHREPLRPIQLTYKVGKSIDSALYQLTYFIQKTLDEKEIALCAFLDIEVANISMIT